jgi:hypothetical protein
LQVNALALQVNVLALQVNALALQVNVLTLQVNVLALQVDDVLAALENLSVHRSLVEERGWMGEIRLAQKFSKLF